MPTAVSTAKTTSGGFFRMISVPLAIQSAGMLLWVVIAKSVESRLGGDVGGGQVSGDCAPLGSRRGHGLHSVRRDSASASERFKVGLRLCPGSWVFSPKGHASIRRHVKSLS